jgi:hypothetical protein
MSATSANKWLLVAGIAWVALVAAASGCASAPEPTSAGYTGTWSKGNDRVKSMLYIIDNDKGTWFRWRRWTSDGKLKVDCDWDGRCVGYNEGKHYADYQFTTWKDPASGNLMVECRGTMFDPREAEIYYVDELVLEDDQRTLTSYTVRQLGDVYAPGKQPRRRFSKVSDGVPSPPDEASTE